MCPPPIAAQPRCRVRLCAARPRGKSSQVAHPQAAVPRPWPRVPQTEEVERQAPPTQGLAGECAVALPVQKAIKLLLCAPRLLGNHQSCFPCETLKTSNWSAYRCSELCRGPLERTESRVAHTTGVYCPTALEASLRSGCRRALLPLTSPEKGFPRLSWLVVPQVWLGVWTHLPSSSSFVVLPQCLPLLAFPLSVRTPAYRTRAHCNDSILI